MLTTEKLQTMVDQGLINEEKRDNIVNRLTNRKQAMTNRLLDDTLSEQRVTNINSKIGLVDTNITLLNNLTF
jgi:hypothetical protein